MARPVNADAEATRRRILDSASRLFALHGPEGASVREVASEAGVSLAMVGHYFGSKESLYDAAVAAMFEELSTLQGELARLVAVETPLEGLLPAAVSTAFRFARGHKTAVRLLIRAAVTSGELTPAGRRLLFSTLEVVSEAAARATGRPAASLRLPLQSLVFLAARYAAQSEAELAAVAGLAPGDKLAAVAAVEAHLVALARATLSMGSPTPTSTPSGPRRKS